jgi:tRNA-dihydrouridine synthase C
MLSADAALILAPMDGITDAPMRALQGEIGSFTHAVTEFFRVSEQALPRKVFCREAPELLTGSRTPTGLPVHVQILGGDPERMAISALNAVRAGAVAIDINFGCPAPTVNRNDGGATLLRFPRRIRAIVSAVRQAIPTDIPVSAKLRLGWDSLDAIDENAAMAAEGGADWLTIHARTRVAGYAPPAHWDRIGRVRTALGLPIVANGDIWTIDDFRRCRDVTGCRHFMLGRGALADPWLSSRVACELGLVPRPAPPDWRECFERLVYWTSMDRGSPGKTVLRLKQWIKIASKHGDFPGFDQLKLAKSLGEFFEGLNRMSACCSRACSRSPSRPLPPLIAPTSPNA